MSNQRKLVLIALTVLVSTCLYVTYTLSKKMQALIKRVLSVESHMLLLEDSHVAPKMKIVDSQPMTNSSTSNTFSEDNEDETYYGSDETDTESDVEGDIETISPQLLNGVSNSLHGTSMAISAINAQLATLKNITDTDDDTNVAENSTAVPFHSDSDIADEEYDTDENNAVQDNQSNNDAEEDATQENSHYDTDAEEDSAEEEIEYVIEYETVSEDEEENTNDTSAKDNIDQYIHSVSQQHTKNRLQAILKEHDLSTFGNKDTLIKRIMTIDNFENVLQSR